MNLYAYVGGDPVNWYDPWGLEAFPSNAKEYERALEYALQACEGGCYNPDSPDDPRVDEYDTNFGQMSKDLSSETIKWPEATTVHGTAHESPKNIPGTSFKLKAYEDPKRGDVRR